jgi:hypothetical protein
MIFKSPTQPLCRYCGGKIAKVTESVYFTPVRPNISGLIYEQAIKAAPHSRQEAQRHVNQQIVSVRWARKDVSPDARAIGEFIERVSTWDGESYEDEFFCSAPHARRFAYVMARAGYRAM